MHKAEQINSKTSAGLYWFLTIGYMALIFYLSSSPDTGLPEIFPEGFDKFTHAGVYAVLASLFYSSLSKSGVRKYVFVLALLLSALYGFSDELHQSFVPGRDPSFGDLIADFIGSALGSYFAGRFFKT